MMVHGQAVHEDTWRRSDDEYRGSRQGYLEEIR